MKKWLRILFLIALLGYVMSLMVQTKKEMLTYKKVDSMREVGDYILSHTQKFQPQEVLCAFDIDMTLILPEHPACYPKNLKQHIDIYRDLQRQYENLDYTSPFVNTLWYPQRVIDEDLYETLERLAHFKKIALTATLTGAYLEIPRLEVLRYQQLKDKNIDFEESFSAQDFVLEECPSYRSYKPSFYKGVLCSNSERGTTTKGTVLCAFLRKMKWCPKCIVLVDDRLQNLSDVQSELKSQFPRIKFIGLQFTGAAHYCPQTISEKEFQNFWADCFQKAQLAEDKAVRKL